MNLLERPMDSAWRSSRSWKSESAFVTGLICSMYVAAGVTHDMQYSQGGGWGRGLVEQKPRSRGRLDVDLGEVGLDRLS